ncbi:MAG: MerR family transcriptional regulator [Rhodospirillales bacterium]|nr:MerR family transcriptional regulator [Rhodospirillales bacterium]MBO6786822.1 MerR family transcriptional regulator [Rhodospirillales bacterium]
MSDSSPDDRAADKAEKSASAFRTISEVAAELDLPQHVLRFWETKFPQVKPMKRGGGRRYYRPDDLQLLRRIRDLLYVDGYTIKGVQKLLRQSGSVRNFVNEDEAKIPLGEGTSATEQDIAPATQPVSDNSSALADRSVREELVEIVNDLKGLRDQLAQSAS